MIPLDRLDHEDLDDTAITLLGVEQIDRVVVSIKGQVITEHGTLAEAEDIHGAAPVGTVIARLSDGVSLRVMTRRGWAEV